MHIEFLKLGMHKLLQLIGMHKIQELGMHKLQEFDMDKLLELGTETWNYA